MRRRMKRHRKKGYKMGGKSGVGFQQAYNDQSLYASIDKKDNGPRSLFDQLVLEARVAPIPGPMDAIINNRPRKMRVKE